MNKLLSLTAVFICTNLFGQTYIRHTNELSDAFVKRVFNVEELSYPIIETKEWDSLKKVILCFVPYTKTIKYGNETEEETFIVGYVLILTAPNTYRQVLIDTITEDYGGAPIVETVFFANADKDKEREIAVMISYTSFHKGAGIDGTYYETRIYDNPDLLVPTKKLKYLEKLSNQFYCFEGDTQGKASKCKYKDFKAIRIKLKELGF